jgi:hypothetical protein
MPTTDSSSISCSLTADGARAQLREWASLGDALRAAEAAADGIVLWFEPEVEAELRDLAQREAACCSFLDLTVAAHGRRLRLEISSPAPSARPVIDALVASIQAGSST